MECPHKERKERGRYLYYSDDDESYSVYSARVINRKYVYTYTDFINQMTNQTKTSDWREELGISELEEEIGGILLEYLSKKGVVDGQLLQEVPQILDEGLKPYIEQIEKEAERRGRIDNNQLLSEAIEEAYLTGMSYDRSYGQVFMEASLPELKIEDIGHREKRLLKQLKSKYGLDSTDGEGERIS